MKWVILAALLPAAAMAEGTRHDLGTQVGAIGLDMVLPDGIALSEPDGSVRFEVGRAEESFALVGVSSRQVADGTAHRFRVAPDEQGRATAFWDRHGPVRRFVPFFRFCRSGPSDGIEAIRYSLYWPGLGSTRTQELGRASMARIAAKLSPCSPPERAD